MSDKEKAPKQRQCPLLKKFYSLNQREDWQKAICYNSCILQPLCIEDLKTITSIKKQMEEAWIPCPHCQSDPIITRDIRLGARLSGLRKNEDDDWACFYCGFIIHKLPPLKYTKRGPNKKEK